MSALFLEYGISTSNSRNNADISICVDFYAISDSQKPGFIQFDPLYKSRFLRIRYGVKIHTDADVRIVPRITSGYTGLGAYNCGRVGRRA
jgi:hypothetical protein